MIFERIIGKKYLFVFWRIKSRSSVEVEPNCNTYVRVCVCVHLRKYYYELSENNERYEKSKTTRYT